MAQIKVNLTQLNSAPPREASLEKLLEELAWETRSIRRQLRMEVAGQEHIEASLLRVAEQLETEANYANRLRDGLLQILDAYRKAEDRNSSSLAAPPSAGIS